MNDEDPDAFYSKADESNAFSEYDGGNCYYNNDNMDEEFKVFREDEQNKNINMSFEDGDDKNYIMSD